MRSIRARKPATTAALPAPPRSRRTATCGCPSRVPAPDVHVECGHRRLSAAVGTLDGDRVAQRLDADAIDGERTPSGADWMSGNRNLSGRSWPLPCVWKGGYFAARRRSICAVMRASRGGRRCRTKRRPRRCGRRDTCGSSLRALAGLRGEVAIQRVGAGPTTESWRTSGS